MELLKKVESLEVKRCFVFSQRFTSKENYKDLLKISPLEPTKETFSKNIKTIKAKILKLKEASLDCIITVENDKRVGYYNSVKWFIGYVNLTEVGLWHGAGGLPETWTKNTLKDSAEKLSLELKKKSRYSQTRAMKVVPKMVVLKDSIQKEKLFLPIVLPGGFYPRIRRGMNKTKMDIDDGCMRSLAFAVSGDKKIKAYIGINI